MEVYADHAATTPISETALQAMLPCFQEFYGNPSSQHAMGRQARRKLESARAQVAACLGCDAREIYFTSGGTEADNQAVLTAANAGQTQGKKHIVTTSFEHHALVHTLEKLEKQGFTVTYLEINPDTHNITPEQVAQAIRQDTCLVTILYANNEIGSILPIPEIGSICRQAGVLFHVDGVQAVGHIPVHVRDSQIDLLSLSGHKFHGPKGVGALYIRRGIEPVRLLEGGGQERGQRPGTENLPAVCGMAAALQEELEHMEENTRKITAMADFLRDTLGKLPGCHLNGDPMHHLPGIVSCSFEGVDSETLLILLDSSGICASAGSACTSGSLEPSHVMRAIGRSPASGSLRLSLSHENTMEQMQYIVREVSRIVNSLRQR